MTYCYITSTGSYLPGEPVDNESLGKYLGKVIGEGRVRTKILKVNGIETRHYALDKKQNATHSLYELAAEAVRDCLPQDKNPLQIDYLSAGTTHAPFLAPGISSILHDQLSKEKVVSHSLEINSNSGICSSGAQAIVNAARAVKSGDAVAAICVGVEQSSTGLNQKRFVPRMISQPSYGMSDPQNGSCQSSCASCYPMGLAHFSLNPSRERPASR